MSPFYHHKIIVIYLSFAVIFTHPCWAESDGIQEGDIDLSGGTSKINEQNIDLQNSSDNNIIEQNIPLSGDAKKSAADTEINIPETDNSIEKTEQKSAPPEKDSYIETTAIKLGGGILDIVTCVLEIPKTMVKVSQDEGLATGLTVGLVKGIANTTEQAISGAANVATFPVPKKLEIDLVENPDNFSMEETFGAAFKDSNDAAGSH